MSLALATGTAPAAWWHESDAVIATAVALIEDQIERTE